MNQEMRSWKQRSLDIASRSTTSLRGHLAQRDIRIPTRRELQPGDRGYIDGTPNQKQSWSQWVGEKVSNARRGQSDDPMSAGVDEVVLFPGWATRRYHRAGTLDDSFGMDVFVSGYASNRRPPEFATRSQKTFLRLAKGFAALPKLLPHHEEEDPPVLPVSRSTEELLASIRLPPRPTEISEYQQVEALEEGFRHLGDEDGSETASNVSCNSSSSDLPAANFPVTSTPISSITADARRLHTNLESRLQPFWSTTLASRTIKLSLFASPHDPALSESEQAKEPGWDGLDHGPVAIQEVITSSDGSFQTKFSVSWEDMCQHPGALHIAFGDPTLEHNLLISAELLPASILQPQTQGRPQTSLITQRISLTYSPMRVISDIDDTVKLSNILSGARTVFHNVFVKEMRDIVIPGMGEWYNEMWKRGVRFHYVSNGPFELIPVVNEFFEVSRLPPGSVRLKSYAGRSLFNGLLSAPATRKRAGILDILDNFLDSRFILIGDTGEQDLELYAAIAKERPQQISGVFVRDVGAYDNGLQGLEDPTGVNINIALPRSATKDVDAMFTQTIGPKTPVKRGSEPYATELPPMPKPPRRSMSDIASTIRAKPTRTLSKLSLTSGNNNNGNIMNGNFFTSTTRAGSPVSSTSSRSRQPPNDIDGSYPPGGFPQDTTNMTEQEKKRMELQIRVYKARTQMPSHVYLRVFRKAEECVEASEILDALDAGSN